MRAVARPRSCCAFLSVSGLFVTVALSYTGGLQGTGDTRSPLYISIVSQVIVPLGFCAILQATRGLQASDIWLAIVLGHMTRCLLSFGRFRQQKWREHPASTSSRHGPERRKHRRMQARLTASRVARVRSPAWPTTPRSPALRACLLPSTIPTGLPSRARPSARRSRRGWRRWRASGSRFRSSSAARRSAPAALQQAVMPHDHAHVLADWHGAESEHVLRAIAAAAEARREWASGRGTSARRCSCAPRSCWPPRGAPRSTRRRCSASRRPSFQAEIDAASELVDFWRFNPHFAQQLYEEQPLSPSGVWNAVEYRPLEGFVYAVTPFNFTSIAGNLPTAPALMGNTVVWKPAATAIFSGYYIMRLLEAAGLPPGRHQLRARRPRARSPRSRSTSPDLAGVHFTGSTAVFNGMWKTVGDNIGTLPQLPAPGGRDRRQGLHPGARLGRRRGAGRGHRARRLRVPGTEVLGGEPRLRAGVALARRARPRRWR